MSKKIRKQRILTKLRRVQERLESQRTFTPIAVSMPDSLNTDIEQLSEELGVSLVDAASSVFVENRELVRSLDVSADFATGDTGSREVILQVPREVWDVIDGKFDKTDYERAVIALLREGIERTFCPA